VLQLQHRLTPGLLDFESRNSPLLSSQIPISERLQAFLFVFFMFFSKLVLFLLKKMAWTKHIFLET
jgi:hypothetical protein